MIKENGRQPDMATQHLVEGTRENTKSRVLGGPGMLGEFEVNVGWPETGERLGPIVAYRCGGTDKQKDICTEDILHADNLAVVADGKKISRNS